MENKKSNKGLVIVLVIVMLVLFIVCTLFFTGVLKSPFVKETTTEVTDTTTTENTKTDDSKTKVKETRYYQHYVLAEGEEPDRNIINFCAEEIQLNPDGTTKVISGGACTGYSWEGRYIEDDSSIALLLNSADIDICKDRTISQVEIAGSCKDAWFLIKEEGKLIEASDDVKLYKFTKDDALETLEYKQVQKSDLLTDLKN